MKKNNEHFKISCEVSADAFRKFFFACLEVGFTPEDLLSDLVETFSDSGLGSRGIVPHRLLTDIFDRYYVSVPENDFVSWLHRTYTTRDILQIFSLYEDFSDCEQLLADQSSYDVEIAYDRRLYKNSLFKIYSFYSEVVPEPLSFDDCLAALKKLVASYNAAGSVLEDDEAPF